MSEADRLICEDCGMELFYRDEYAVHDGVWFTVKDSENGHLCLFCLEARLGRPLERSDFSAYPINDGIEEKLRWMRDQPHEALVARSHKKRASFDRRNQQARERWQEKRRQRAERTEREAKERE